MSSLTLRRPLPFRGSTARAMSERGYLCLVVLCCGSRLRTPPTTPAREKGIKLNIAVSVTVDIGATFAFPTSSGHFMWRHADLRPAPCHPAAHQRRRLRCAEPREGGLLGKGVSCLPASQQLVIMEYSYGRFLGKHPKSRVSNRSVHIRLLYL